MPSSPKEETTTRRLSPVPLVRHTLIGRPSFPFLSIKRYLPSLSLSLSSSLSLFLFLSLFLSLSLSLSLSVSRALSLSLSVFAVCSQLTP